MKLTFFDTETTGLEADCRLVQIAYIEDMGFGRAYMCKPPIPISLDAMATHHITNKDIADLEPLSEFAREELRTIAADSVMVAHNAAYDVGVLKNEGVEISKFICTKKVAQNLLDLPNYKLQYLRYYFDLEFEQEINAHDALSDTIVLKAVFEQLANLVQMAYKLDDLDAIHEKMIEITNTPVLLRRIGFGKHSGTPFAEIPKDYLQWLDKQGGHDEDLQFTLDTYLNKLKI